MSDTPRLWGHPLGSNADVNVIPETNPQGASLLNIFPSITQVPFSAGGVAPKRSDFNGLFKLLGDNIFYLQRGGVYPYQQGVEYKAGNVVSFNAKIFLCVQATSGEEDPTNGDYWALMSSGIDYATTVKAGLIKVGDGLSVTADGTLSATAQELEPATASRLGGVKIGSGINVTAEGVISTSSIPAGSLVPFAGRTVPNGFLLCNGATVSRTTYSALFAAIGTIYGGGDGSSTFALPNFNNRFIMGTTASSSVGAAKTAGLPNITGSIGTYRAANGSGAFSNGAEIGGGASAGGYYPAGYFNFNSASSSSIYGSSTTVQPPAYMTSILIKY